MLSRMLAWTWKKIKAYLMCFFKRNNDIVEEISFLLSIVTFFYIVAIVEKYIYIHKKWVMWMTVVEIIFSFDTKTIFFCFPLCRLILFCAGFYWESWTFIELEFF
jgi:hypothetical protein